MSDLSKRVVACRHWRWMPGMLAKHPNWRDYRVSHVGRTGMHGACRYSSPVGGLSYAVVALPLPTSSDVLPDLTDPATLGCLLALVREAWGCRTAYFTHSHGSWLVMRRDPWSLPLCEPQDTEAEALIAALEAAP